jgi:hypothetical protein
LRSSCEPQDILQGGPVQWGRITSTNFTPGGFFISTIRVVGLITFNLQAFTSTGFEVSGNAGQLPSNLIVFVWSDQPMSTNDGMSPDWMQLEQAGGPSGFVPRLVSEELALCQRFFVSMTALASPTPNTYSQSLPCMMRQTPTVTQTFDGGTGATYTMLSSAFADPCAFRQATAHSQLATATINFDAEL